jgi:hypothetical protein
MIGLFEVGGLFLMIAGTLRFTSWAEGWLSKAPSTDQRRPLSFLRLRAKLRRPSST